MPRITTEPVRRLGAALVAAGLALAALAGCSDPQGPIGGGTTSPQADPTTEDDTTEESTSEGQTGEVTASPLATDLVTPWDVVALDDGRSLVSSRDTGQILLLSPDGDPQVLATIPETAPTREGGLLGLALTEDESLLFAYVSTAGDNRVLSMTWDGTSLGTPEVILSGIPIEQTHNGGGLVIGPDGYLYVSTGDARDPSISQDLDSLGGKILRITTSGDPAPGNPFGTLVYSYGHRNVQGLSFDEAGRLWASEFGENDWDELNLVEAGGNYGWPDVEGFGGAEVDADYIDPLVTWRTDDASPSGLAFWQGSLWMPALRGEALWEIPLDGDRPGEPVPHLVGQHGRLRAATVSADGDALLVTTSNTDGRGEPEGDDDKVLVVTR